MRFNFKPLRKVTWIICLWFIFTVGCFFAPLLAIVIPFFKRHTYIYNFVLAADRMCAALLGFSGRLTLSTEVTHEMRWVYKMLNEIEENHCEESAYNEGAYCRISDRKLGHK